VDLVHHPTFKYYASLHFSRCLKTGNKFTLHVPICRYSQTTNKLSKIQNKTLELKFWMLCLMIKNEAISPCLQAKHRKRFPPRGRGRGRSSLKHNVGFLIWENRPCTIIRTVWSSLPHETIYNENVAYFEITKVKKNLNDCRPKEVKHGPLGYKLHTLWHSVGRDSSVGIATRYRLDCQGIESRWEILPIHPGQPWGPPNPLYNGYRVFLGVKRLGHGIDHPPHLATRSKKE